MRAKNHGRDALLTSTLGDPDGVLVRRRRGGGRTSRSRPRRRSRCASRRSRHSDRRASARLHLRLAVRAPHRQRERARVLVPVGPLEDPGLALEPAAVRLLDVRRGTGRRRRRRSARRGGAVACAARERAQRSVLGLACGGSERNGHDHERDALGDRRLAEVALAQVDALADAGSRGALRAQTASMPAEESTPITGCPPAATGIAIRPVPTPSSTTGPPDASACST